MRIVNYLGTNKDFVAEKRHNIFIGISLGNRYFSNDRIYSYIKRGLEHTASDVLVVIADSNHAINYSVFNGYSVEKALNVATKRGDEVQAAIEKICNKLSESQKLKVNVARRDKLINNDWVKEATAIVYQEFENNKEFYDYITGIVLDNLGEKVSEKSILEVENLATYVLNELPVLLNCVQYNNKKYDLHPYPGLSKLDDLLMGLQDRTMFTEIADCLGIKNKIAVVEAYIE